MYIKPTGKPALKPEPREKKKPQPIRKKSEKREIEEREYLKRKKEYLKESPKCQVLKCHRNATDIHHKKGRAGSLYLDVAHWMGVCRSCHRWIEDNPAMAKAFGYSEDRTI